MLNTGTIIAERYEILSKVGTGGMADVYKAKDHKLNRFVAVKVLKPEFREDRTFIRKFKSEAQAAAGLTHPNIVNVFDVGDDEGVYYIVMELIEGITLKEYISKKGKLSVKEATSIAIQVSMGLNAAHNHKIVHRDVKPQNIIISTDGKVKVTDFGIARAASSNTISSNVMGSVHYSSPEQVRGGYSDEKSDIYSLGITIYEMVTGRVPFDGDTTVSIAIKHLQEEMVPPSAYAPDLPYSLEQIIYKCTQKSVDRRYNNMEEVIADLKRSLVDPQGDFVKLNSVDTAAKTLVISDEELGEIKQTSNKKQLEEVEEVEKEIRREKEKQEEKGPKQPPRNKKKRKHKTRLVPIILLCLGIAALVAVIYTIIRMSGLFGTGEDPAVQTTVVEAPTEAPENTAIIVPELTGMTEDEAKQVLSELNIGLQFSGEEASTLEQGLISRTEPAAGTQVEENTTIRYYLSKGDTALTIPGYTDVSAIQFQNELEDMGLNVTTAKEYSDADEYGNALVEPGYVLDVSPATGTSVQAGETVTVTVSRGLDFGDSAEMPNVVGLLKNDALTVLGKFIDIDVIEVENSDTPGGEVMSQSIEAGTYVDPDMPVTITISKEEEPAPAAEPAVAADGTWKSRDTLNTPDGYQGGDVRLELVQEVGGQQTVTTIAEGSGVQFPYQLDQIGLPGVTDGAVYVYEMIDGSYQMLGKYNITFVKVD